MEDEMLFDKALLMTIDFEARSTVKFNPPISPLNPGKSLCIRPLSAEDFERGFPQVLNDLTVVGEVSKETFIERFQEMKTSGNSYITVVEDTDTSQIVASATLDVERKFIHECAIRGRIEDVVVKSDYRGRQLGKLLLSTLTLLSKDLGCYKTTLECAETTVPFYEKFGYVPDAHIYMQNRH